jgi:hypothetical protein
MRIITVTVAASPLVVPMLQGFVLPLTIAAVPGAGGTLLVETQTAPGGQWFPWSEGTAGVVSAAAQAKLDSKVHALRFTAATAAGSVELGF